MAHASHDKIMEQAKGTPKGKAIAAMGDNSKNGSPLSDLLKGAVQELTALDAKIKLINTEKKDIRNRVKENGISIQAFNDVYRDLKLEDAIRRDREEDRAIVKDCLGLQLNIFDQAAIEPEHDAAKIAKDEAAAAPLSDAGKKKKKKSAVSAAEAAMASGTPKEEKSAVH